MKDSKQTNKQKEAIVLKGVATSINAMAFPNFQNLQDMLLCFNYYIMPLDTEQMNIQDLYVHLKNSPISEINSGINIVKDVSVLQKIYQLLKNVINMEDDEKIMASALTESTDFVALSTLETTNIKILDKETLEGINILANHPRVGVITSIPLGRHNGETFAMCDYEYYNNIDDILKIIIHTNSDVLIYRFSVIEFAGNVKYAIRYFICNKLSKIQNGSDNYGGSTGISDEIKFKEEDLYVNPFQTKEFKIKQIKNNIAYTITGHSEYDNDYVEKSCEEIVELIKNNNDVLVSRLPIFQFSKDIPVKKSKTISFEFNTINICENGKYDILDINGIKEYLNGNYWIIIYSVIDEKYKDGNFRYRTIILNKNSELL